MIEKNQKKIFYLDTNALYYILGLSTNKKVKIAKLKKLTHTSAISLNILSIFELLNNINNTDKVEIIDKLNGLSSHILIACPAFLKGKITYKEIDMLLSVDHYSIVMPKLTKYTIKYISYEFAYVITLACSIIPQMFLYFPDYNSNHYRVDEYEKSLEVHTYQLIQKLDRLIQKRLLSLYKKNGSISEKETVSIFRLILVNLSNHLVTFANPYISIINSSSDGKISFFRLRKSLLSNIKSLDFDSLLVDNNLNFNDVNLLKSFNIDKSISEIFDIYSNKFITMGGYTFNKSELVEKYSLEFLKDIFINSQKLYINDLIDMEIINGYLNNIASNKSLFITFDKNVIRKMSSLYSHNFQDSLDMIESLQI
ncbi:hypothetical protein [Mariniplasma anaerobium]|uniref:PIN domain-containing protein n=1 Tax=Mariniplasma anaerobium TaxID=2735436 RepID=A0A7U9XVP1_9MOLU|nr:hypothetical protein [Mariniplasma anaerobium]BCR36595.1 hypothetical protein MPAN_014880 [Mariniplasma anaerobium]